eukprot:scaffold2649_cov100-Skeletonema_dohrnii-CCMP3373.AAC.11
MKIYAPLAAASLCVASRVVAFSPPMHQHRRAAILSSAVAKDTDTHIVETPASSTATKDAAERLDDIMDAREETEQERTVSSTSQQTEE